MRLLKLKLHKYKRLRLNMIDTFEFNPTAPTQFIIGTNGAGKSSLIQECSPLPPDKNEYDKGGYKHVIFLKDNIQYSMKSEDVGGTWHHSFERDGKELNEGGTITVQLQLIKEYMNYWPEIHDLIIGQNDARFTKMSFTERRRWFTLLANSNYDYAVGVFKRVTEKLNGSKHALKRAKDNLVIETKKLLPAEELDQLRDVCSDLYVQAQRLIEKRKPLIDPSESYIQRANKAAAHYEAVASKTRGLVKRLHRMPSELPRSAQQITEELIQAKAVAANLQSQSDRYYEDHQRIQRLWESMQASKLENAAQIQQQIDDCDKTIAEAGKACPLDLAQTASAAITIASCDKLLAWWPDVQAGFHDNTDRGWGRVYLQELNDDIEKRKTTLNQLSTLIARNEQTVEHHESHQGEQKVDCPKCSHSFQPNFSEHIFKEAVEKLRKFRSEYDRLNAEFKERVEHQEEVQAYLRHYSSVMQQLRNYPGLESFTAWVAAEYILVNSPSTFSSHLHRFRDQAGQWQRIEAATAKRQEIKQLAGELLARDNSGLSVADERTRLEELIGECEFNKSTTQAKIESLSTMLSIVNGITDLGAQLQAGIDTVDKLHNEAADSIRRETFAQILRELQSQLHIKESALMAAERQQSVIEHIESEINTLIQEVEDYKVLQKELSPTEGMIAEGMVGFMNMFVDQMNQTCSQLFSYPLKIQPCAAEGDSLNLNYKFPIIVDKEKRPDVRAGSSGMKEVFDLAFVIAAMKAIGLSSYPLFLDEFGKGLDPVHKRASVSLLTSLMELEPFEQVYLISHDVAQYGALGRSEICVLHEANAVIPHGYAYNRHVKINGV